MRPNKITSIIIEGIDRTGKDTIINGLLNEYGYHQVVHFEKPKALACYGGHEAGLDRPTTLAAFRYQHESFTNMFRMMSSDARFIFNRAHLGECVYSPLYRNYDGNYVFDIEQDFINRGKAFPRNTLLVMLHAPDLNILKDDGQSFDASKKKEEQAMFREAYERSAIPNKIMVPVTYPPSSGRIESQDIRSLGQFVNQTGFRPPADILQDVCNAIYTADR
jgi:thymidylate kinase